MALLQYQQIQIVGTVLDLDPVALTDTVAADPRGFYEVANGSGAPVDVTVVVPGSQYGQARADVVVAVAAGQTRQIGPLVPDLADPDTGLITITHESITSVTGAAKRV